MIQKIVIITITIIFPMTKTQLLARKRLSEFGIKPSLQRIAILDFLIKNRIHPSADTIYNHLSPSIPTLSKTTVYNTLKLLEEERAIVSILIEDKSVRYDADITPHAHFKCKKCEQIFDIPILETDKVEIANASELTVTDQQVYLYGYCKECSKKIN